VGTVQQPTGVEMFEGFTKIQSLSIRKFKPVLFPIENEQSDILNFSEESIIKTKLILKSELKISYKGCIEKTQIADITFNFEDGIQPSASLFVEVNDVYEFDSQEEGDDEKPLDSFELKLKLKVKLPLSELKYFLNYLNTNFCVYISCSLNNKADIVLEKTWANFEIDYFEYSYLINHDQVKWYSYGVQSIANSYLQKLSIGYSGQLRQIIEELSESAVHADLILNEDDKDLETVFELIRDLRCALREKKDDPSADYDFSNLWHRDSVEFQTAIKIFPQSEQKELIEKYDQLWTNIDISSGLKWGEDKYGAIAKGFDPIQDQIEDVAIMFLKLKVLQSRKLEQILISSLIFAETIAFGRNLFSKKKNSSGSSVSPRFIDSKEIDDPSYFQIIINTVLETGKVMLLEAIKLVSTFFIALVVTSENIMATWIVTTGYTVFRWWRQVFIASLTPENKQYALLDSMIQIYRLSTNYNFDASHLKTQLNEVSKEGAVFSPYIFTLLDLQIERRRKT
jgi:hypothetical protein